ncbi:hypothetical protein F2Q68_00038685 [Brassica cretica]|uniref:Uncharacterized protein n=1 Tax=Brassica cretica TaxID=69181 RepID=A0A8S9MLZ1_BRACR|nr:hypothetical protein F2Q68_00038685 [Brassica cretica]
MKNGDMNQSKKRLEYIAGIAGNCPSQEGFKCKEKPNAFKRKGTGGVLDIWLHHKGILRQCPQESPLVNGQILIDGQNSLIRWWSKDICVDSLPNHVVLGGVSCLSVRRYKVMLKFNLVKNIKGCVESLSSSDGWMAGHVLSNSGCCTLFKDFDSRLNADEWNRKAKEEINLQKDVQVSVHALEQLGSQLKTLDEGFKKIMKGLQALLKVELRGVRRDKRRQGDAEDEQACSSIKRFRHKVRVMDLDQTGGVLSSADTTKERSRQRSLSVAKIKSLGGRSHRYRGLYTQDRESNDLVNHIRGIFQYFIVDVVDPRSTPDVARCGRELGEQFLSHEQG